MKTCTKCGETKDKTEFYKRSKSSDGLTPCCKVCRNIANAAYSDAHPDKAKAYAAKYRLANADKRNAYYVANKEKSSVRQAKYRADNSDMVKASGAAYRAANPEKVKAAIAKWAAENPEAVRINNQNRRARKRQAGGTLSKGLAANLFKLQKGKCPCCGNPLGKDYHMDHKKPLALGGSNADDNIQLLRSTCNVRKGAKDPIDFMQSKGFLL